ncbi:NADPH-dependent glutamate synthase [Candidatus Hydrogenedentota bacterium]
MFKIVRKVSLSDDIKEFDVEAPLVARKALPGNFVLVRGDERGERIPLTIADSDAEKGTLTIVLQTIGKGTVKLGALEEGDSFLDVVGPLGKGRVMESGEKTVCCVSGGLGVAPMFPQTKAHHKAGHRVISIIGARNKDYFFWQDRVEAISDKVLYGTDDGSMGFHGFAAQMLDNLIDEGEKLDEVIAIGPVPHMKAVVEVCKKYSIPVVVSLNPIMVDGTGMCGGCRVTVGGETKFACVDGPEFDGANVDFDELMARQRTYKSIEDTALKKHETEEHECKLGGRQRMPNRNAEERGKDFVEVALGFSDEQAKAEASRCIACKKPKCVDGCPVEVDIPGFIKAIQENDFARAAEVLKDKNSLPAICGRVCPQENQCEELCILGKKSEPLAIGGLERFVADWEADHITKQPAPVKSNGRNVAVLGCGPGGLTCAGDLAKEGYDVTIFEAFHATGGVLRYGIPEFRLPKTIVDREVNYVISLGVEVRLNMLIGKVLTIEELMEEGFEAVFIAVGAGAPMFLGIPGENMIGVYSANEFLTRVNLMKAYSNDYDTPVLVGDHVAVVGAGNVAMDAARVALRLGAKEVSIVYRRSEAEMPARAEEVEHAKEEGIVFRTLTNPVEIIGDENNAVVGMKCLKMELGEPDDSGRRRPVPIEGSEFTLDCDMAVPALGNQSNPILTSNTKDLELNKWGNIVVDPETFATNLPGIYAGGDIVTGAATVIEAMGAGKVAARSIGKYLQEK